MAQDNRIKMECTECGHIYDTTKNKKMIKERLTLKKHCERCRVHRTFKETK